MRTTHTAFHGRVKEGWANSPTGRGYFRLVAKHRPVVILTELKGVAGYPEGFSEPRDAYRQALQSPLHDRSYLHGEAQVPAGAVHLTSDWMLILPAEASEQIHIAVADFRRFMEVCMETSLEVVAGEDTKGATHNCIALRLAPHQLKVPESYTIHAGPTRIIIRGADATGLQYAMYELEEKMRRAGGPFLAPYCVLRQPWLETRILRSFFAPYYRIELLDDIAYYPDEYLNRLAHHRINGIWLHLKLRDIVPSRVFPEFGEEVEPPLTRLRNLAQRAGRYGIRVFVYLNEPRNLPRGHPFWEKYPHLQGAPSSSFMDDEPTTFAMCTSQPQVLEFLKDSSQRLFEEVPNLGGVFLITASEHHTHCFSHVQANSGGPPYEQVQCPRCCQRRPGEVVVEVIEAICQGIHSAAPKAKVIVWNWSWEGLYGREAAREIIQALPDDCMLMLDFERGDQKTILGKDVPIDEYALSFVGPSQRFQQSNDVAGDRNLPVYAKLQFVSTHELPNTPYLPLPGVVYDKLARLQDTGANGMLGCWIFGNYPGLITDLAGRLYLEPFAIDKEDVLAELAERYFAPAAVPNVLEAWDCFAQAWAFYPFNIPLLYTGPHVKGPAFPWYLEPIHKPVPANWRDNQAPGDNLLGIIPDQDVLWLDRALGELLNTWTRGLQALESAFEKLPSPTREQYQEYGLARCIYHQMTSLRNTVRFYVEREFLLRSPDQAERRAILSRLRDYIKDELANAEGCRPYVEADSRLGWHSECFAYQFTPEEIDQRVAQLREMAEVTIPHWLRTNKGLVQPQPYAEPLSDKAYERLRQQIPGLDLMKGVFND